MTGVLLASLVAGCVVVAVISGNRMTGQVRERNRERLRRRLHKDVTLLVANGKLAYTVTGRVEEVLDREVILRERNGRSVSVALSGVLGVRTARQRS